MRPGFQKALGKVTSLTDSVMDDRLREMAAAKQPPPDDTAAHESGEGMEAEAEVELTPEELLKLKALLSKG